LTPVDPQTVAAEARTREEARQLRAELHRHLIHSIEEDRSNPAEWDQAALSSYVEQNINEFVTSRRIAVNGKEFSELVRSMIDELGGLGPIQCLVEDDSVNDVLVNGHGHVFVERRGRLEETPIRFIDDAHVLRIIQKIVAPLGRRVDESCPMVDARLADGSRVNAIIPPVAVDGPCLSIRKFRKDPLRAADLLHYGSLSHEMMELLRAAVRARCNILISGGTGAGKTTLLNVLSQDIGEGERVVTIEDTAELTLANPHVVRLETRPPNLEGRGEITARALVRNALRMRPDRIILGEVRHVEVIDMLQAMNTGHHGSMATVHANSPRDALSRLELLAGFGGFAGSETTLRQNVASAIDVVVQLNRFASGERRLVGISELTRIADGRYLTQDLMSFDPVSGVFRDHGLKPYHEGLVEALRAVRPSTSFGFLEDA
jgi:pilus assembly protein CpaF